MIKVLNIITKSDWAGAQRIVYEICKCALESPNAIIEVAIGDEGILADKLRLLGIKVHVLNNLVHPITPLKDLCGFFELVKLIQAENYDVVHCHSTKAGILGRMAAKVCNVRRRIYTVHGWWPILRYSNRFVRSMAVSVERLMALMTTDLVLISQSDLEAARQMKIGSDRIYQLIPNAISIENNADSGVLRREQGIEASTVIVGNVARVDAQKNPDLFIEIAKEFDDDSTVFVWLGDGPDLERVRDEIKSSKLEDKIRFIGFRENGIDYMNDFDVLFMTSRSEGVPITILEAVALEKKIFSSDVGGIKEFAGNKNVYKLDSSMETIVKKLEEIIEAQPVQYAVLPNRMCSDYFRLYNN